MNFNACIRVWLMHPIHLNYCELNISLVHSLRDPDGNLIEL